MTDTTESNGLGDKLSGPLNAIIDKKRAELLPLLAGGAGQATQAASRIDECVRKVATFCVSLVMNNREKVLGRLSQQAAA